MVRRPSQAGRADFEAKPRAIIATWRLQFCDRPAEGRAASGLDAFAQELAALAETQILILRLLLAFGELPFW
jgi:hypothetical protein